MAPVWFNQPAQQNRGSLSPVERFASAKIGGQDTQESLSVLLKAFDEKKITWLSIGTVMTLKPEITKKILEGIEIHALTSRMEKKNISVLEDPRAAHRGRGNVWDAYLATPSAPKWLDVALGEADYLELTKAGTDNARTLNAVIRSPNVVLEGRPGVIWNICLKCDAGVAEALFKDASKSHADFFNFFVECAPGFKEAEGADFEKFNNAQLVKGARGAYSAREGTEFKVKQG
ncbi:MAG: hypothetical protein WC861_01250 [Candidatus Micrarchaeia archaeon]|jgi:hypothetical protein